MMEGERAVRLSSERNLDSGRKAERLLRGTQVVVAKSSDLDSHTQYEVEGLGDVLFDSCLPP